MNKNNTAILLFSRTATAEAAAKPLSIGKRSAESVAAFLINHAKNLTAKTQLPVFFFSEKQQRGDTFGERFANAFEDVFAKGFENVISIGNDCLTISTSDILDAADALQTTPLTQSAIPQGGAVLGATNDGGAYLIGLQKDTFQKYLFQDIQWQTESVFDELIKYVEQSTKNTENAIVFLAQKSDIDHVSDWKTTLQAIPLFLNKILTRLLFFLLPIPSERAISPVNASFLTSAIALRAPPHFQ